VRPPVFAAVLACAAAVLLGGCTERSTPASPRTLALSPCRLGTPGKGEPVEARCGRLAVWEDWHSRRGKQLSLRVAVIPATGRTPAPDPLFLLAGGPGQAATEAFPATLAAFARVNRTRDLVLVDQRGTGGSGALRCPSAQQSLTLAEVQAAVGRCARTLRVDPRFYLTPAAVADLDAVRAALGYQRINLYGASYGSRVALDYLRTHGAYARTAILDGVVPTDWNLGETAATDAQRALDHLFGRCRADAECRGAFPNLEEEFAALFTRLGVRRLPLAVAQPATGAPLPLVIDRDGLAGTVRLLSYTAETAALLPLLIHQAHSRNDYAPLAVQARLVGGELSDGFSDGLYYAVTCAEDAPFLDRRSLAASAKGTYAGVAAAASVLACAAWPGPPAERTFKAPVRSAVPVLMLSGAADPVTPPANAERAGRTLANSRALVAPGQGHIVAVRGCAPQLIDRFVQAGSFADFDGSCLARTAPTPFFIDFAGPAP